MNVPPIVALEIGTTKVRVLVGESREDGQIMITGYGEAPSRGVRKADIVDFDIALACVKSAVDMADQSGPVNIHEVHLVLSGGQIRGQINRGSVPVLDETGEITEDDRDHCMDTARAVNLPADRVLLHTISQRFLIDDQHPVINPVGMEGRKLSVDMLLVHGVRSRLRNTVKVVRTVPMEIHDVAFSGLCSALAVLSPEQKEKGVVLIDLGGGTTDYVVYARNAIAWAGTVALGGDHITNDVATGVQVSSSQAEQLKEEHGNALVDMTTRGVKVSVPSAVGSPDRFVSLYDLQTIVHFRAEEILAMVRADLERQDLLHLLGAGVILVGGGANLKNIPELGSKLFGVPCVIGRPRNMSGLAQVTDSSDCAAPLGMVRYGFTSYQRDGGGLNLRNLFFSLFRRS